MATRRPLIALSAAALLIVGCGFARPIGESPGDAPVGTRTASPAVSIDAVATAHAVDVLRAGTRFIDQTSFRTDTELGGRPGGWTLTDSVHKRGIGSLSGPAGPIEIRLIDDAVYMNVPAPDALYPQLGLPG